MKIIFDKGEILTPEQITHLTIYLHHTDQQDKMNEMIDSHIGNMFEVYDYVMSLTYSFYDDKYKVIHAIPELERIHEAISTLPKKMTYKERIDILMPYKEQIAKRILKGHKRSTFHTNEYIDIFELNIDESSGIQRDYVLRCVGRYERIEVIFEYIIKPVMDKQIELDNEYRKIIFEDCMYYYVFNRVKNCFQTSNNLNTIKSVFCYGTEDLKKYLEIFEFVANKFDEFKFGKVIERNKFDVFHKKFNKWVCSSLIK